METEGKEFGGTRVLVVGAGRSGIAVSQVLVSRGAEVTLTDQKTEAEIGGELQGLYEKGVSLELGGHRTDSFLKAQRIVVSPGVPMTLEPLRRARERGIPILGEMELAFSFLKGRVVAVTGTNGKSTTTTLIGEILKRRFRSVFVGGNLGTPLSEALLERESWEVLVVEVSSFQLETIDRFHPAIGVLLNITPDHLDRYPSFEDYVAAKARLFLNMGRGDCAVINGDDPVVMGLVGRIASPLIPFHRKGRSARGVYLEGGEIISAMMGDPRVICRVNELKILGDHNLYNAMAAVAVAHLLNCSEEVIREVLGGFRGLEHRMEWVRDLKGVQFINDSKGTNIGALKMSLESLTLPVILIAGGRDKGGDFHSLEGLIKRRVRHLILLGEAAPMMERVWASVGSCYRVSNLGEAVKQASELAQPGDVVLLSPGCASYDMFKNFEERGRLFKEAVWRL